MKNLYPFLLIVFLFSLCSSPKERKMKHLQKLPFNPNSLSVKSDTPFEKARGQLLYLPIYSNIPYDANRNLFYDLSGFLTVHNTDLSRKINISRVLYFDTEGNLVKDFTHKEAYTLNPLQSKYFYIPIKDQSGVGANFLVEWTSDSAVNIPLIETVMVSLSGAQGVSFLSTGKVLEQKD